MKVHGVIENMSWFTGDDAKRYEIFGAGGGQSLADDLTVPLVGQIPLVPDVARTAHDGTAVRAQPARAPQARDRPARHHQHHPQQASLPVQPH